MITVVIPAKNEAQGITSIIESIRPHAHEIIVVDGHSTDGTKTLAEKSGARVYTDNGKGKGAAYKTGVAAATHDIIVFIDADGSHDPRDIPKLVDPIIHNKAELVIASRHKGGSDDWQGDLNNYLRAIGAGFLSLCINYRWNVRITDCLNGFRAIKRDVFKSLDLKTNDFDIEQHMIVQCLRKGYRIQEVASHEYARQWGKSKLPTYRKAHLFLWRLFRDLL